MLGVGYYFSIKLYREWVASDVLLPPLADGLRCWSPQTYFGGSYGAS